MDARSAETRHYGTLRERPTWLMLMGDHPEAVDSIRQGRKCEAFGADALK